MRMPIQSPLATRMQDFLFFAVVLVFAWAGIDTRLIYHWQGPVFYTFPGLLNDFLKYPGGPADCLYGLIAQAYASQVGGGIVLTAQVVAVAVLTQVYFTTLAGHALPIVRFVPATLLLYHANLYYDRTPLVPALLLGLAPAILFVHLSRRWRSEAALLVAFMTMLAAAYYLGGMTVVFFAPAAAIVHIACRRRPPLWIVYLLLSAALPASVELLRLAYIPVSVHDWFAPPDLRRIIVYWGLYVFYALGTVIALLRTSTVPAPGAEPVSRKAVRTARPLPAVAKLPRAKRPVKRQLTAVPTTAFLLLGLGCVATFSYLLNGQDRRMAALDYYSFSEDWPAVIKASQDLAIEDFNSLTSYEINLALHEMNRLGDDMFCFPQSGSVLLALQENTFLPYLIKVESPPVQFLPEDTDSAAASMKHDPRILAIGKAVPRKLDEINSDGSDSYHSWSSNGRWVIFASKREDGMFARLYIAHLEADGRFNKPFVMPQQDPDFYGRCLMTYNRPELVRQPVTVTATELARAMNSIASQVSGDASPKPGAPAPAVQRQKH
jgi:hypothetical protein